MKRGREGGREHAWNSTHGQRHDVAPAGGAWLYPWMTIRELAAEVAQRGRYRKRDGSEVSAFQTHGKTRNYDQLFERQGRQVWLRERGSSPAGPAWFE